MAAISVKYCLYCFLLLLAGFHHGSDAQDVKGAVVLSSGSFDKVVEKHKVVLVKFDEMPPEEQHQEPFKLVAVQSIKQPDILVADVQIDEEYLVNLDLAARFDIEEKECPKYKLLIKGNEYPINFTGNVQDHNEIKQFVVDNTGLWLGMPSCLPQFDQLVSDYFKAEPGEERLAVLEKTRAAALNVTDDDSKQSADIYVKLMEKVNDKGEGFITKEAVRIEKLVESDVSAKKKEQLSKRSEILVTFQSHIKEGKGAKDEL